MCHAHIHFEANQKTHHRRGWARAMLDKTATPACADGILLRSLKSGILVILEAPNRDDTYNFCKGYLTINSETDPSGKRMQELLQTIAVSPDEVIFANAVQCMPPDRGSGPHVTRDKRKNCHPFLKCLLRITNPRCVLGMGNQALKELYRIEPFEMGGRRLRLSDVKIGKLVGNSIKPWRGTCLVPLYHPGPKVVACACRTGRSKEEQINDMKVVAQELQAHSGKE